MHRQLGCFALVLAATALSCHDSATNTEAVQSSGINQIGTGEAQGKIRFASAADVAPACGMGELTESQILAVTRNPKDQPLADLSAYAPRHAAHAADAALNANGCQSNDRYRYGAGIGDITAPSVGQGNTAYGDLSQVDDGIHIRQFARAFAFESSCGGRTGRAVLVNLEQGVTHDSVRQGVLDALAADTEDNLGQFYDAHNLLISATHTHSAAWGHSHYDLYSIPTAGFDQEVRDRVVASVVTAIRRAHRNMLAGGQGPIRFAQSELLDGNVNRSAQAYALDPAPERAAFVDTAGREVNTNRMMSLLRLTRDDGTNVGALNWYAVHGTSMSQANLLQSSDNKGFAAQRFERDFGADYFSDKTFVSAFNQADEGDASPNLFITDLTDAELHARNDEAWNERGGGKNDFQSTLISGYKQYRHARDLFDQSTETLHGEISSQTIYIDFSRVAVAQPRNYPPALRPVKGGYATCQPALGVSFGGGAEDGRGPTDEGQTCTNLLDINAVAKLPSDSLSSIQNGAIPPGIVVPVGCNNVAYDLLGYACHTEKPILLPMGVSPFDPTQGLGAKVVPIQIVTLGNLAIIALPWEVTTMSSRRIRKAVLDVLQDAGIDYAITASHANSYVHYLTTREEYSSQQYEGASTAFGPWSQEAVQQESVRLAKSLRTATAPTSPFSVDNYRSHPTIFRKIPLFGDGIPSAPFGTVVQQPQASYALGSAPVTVSVSFVSGHPRNDFKTNPSYLYVEKQVESSWKVVATDNDWSTTFKYDGSHALIDWNIPAGTAPGTYRIRHAGASAQGHYEGVTNPFQVLPCQ